MRINIVCTDVGWIYSKFVEMFRKYSKHEILLNKSDALHQVTHYLPYYEVPKNPAHPCTAWVSHMEDRKDLKEKFIYAGKTVDTAISHSKKYADLLKKEHGVKGVQQIIPGVDLDVFKQRGRERPECDKLVVGYIGRQYSSSDRKNPKLLDQMAALPFVKLMVTGGNIAEKDIPEFYANLDLVVSPATIEGGPMAIQEALAVGTPVMCYEDVGVAREFSAGVIRVSKQDKIDTFLSRLDILWRTKAYKQYRHPGIMNQMRAQVLNQTWKRFVLRHDMVWESLHEKV